MKKFLFALLALLLLCPAACAEEVTISAAASLTDAFNDIKAAFEEEHHGVTLVMNYASSGALYRQIEQGAPSDVFASANIKWMNEAEKKGFIDPKTRHDFAANSLVLVTPPDNPAQVATPRDLTKDAVVRVAIGTPEHVPAGQYAKKSLESLGLFETLSPKYVFAETVRQVLDYVRRGEVEAGFVYMTDATLAGDGVHVAAEMPLDAPATYPIAVLTEAAHKDTAAEFVGFVLSDKGQSLLRARGFSKP